MIELMDEYKNELEARVNKRSCDNAESVPDDVAVNVEPVRNREPADFINCRMAVMMMCVDTETAKSGNDCNLVNVVREAAMAVVDEVIVVAEASTSIIAAVGSNVSQPTLTPVANLIALARKVVNKV